MEGRGIVRGEKRRGGFLRKEEVGVDWFWEQRADKFGIGSESDVRKSSSQVKVEVIVPCEEKSLVRSVHEV